MSLINYNFTVFMQEYNGDSGEGGGGEPSFDLSPAAPNTAFTFVESNYQFTDPPRYFKANDPYYYEVDNIPLKQVHENCLWLRDQIVGAELNVTGVPLKKVLDLQPYANNVDRLVNIRPGKFTARINDAYGLSPLFEQQANGPVVDINRAKIYQPPSIVTQLDTFKAIVGSTVSEMIYSNGLYDNYQHHISKLVNDPITMGPNGQTIETSINFVLTRTFLATGGLFITDLPKIKAAVWQPTSDVTANAPYQPDLQQLSLDFCRRWQGVFRTSVVNVSQGLSVEISPFNEGDYLDNDNTPGGDPQVRIDLVFVYTHPIDATQTYLAKDDGGAPEVITAPRLGVVKGAGAIFTPEGGAIDITDGDFPPNFPNQGGQAYYVASSTLNQNEDLAIQAPLADQLALTSPLDPFPGNNTGRSFPSPDDLLNLAPILSQDAVEQELATVGQSVLPLCYVIVRKDSPLIFETDIIDIRPFLRTTELTYNERAGLGGANPPLSLANPATGKAELYNGIEILRDYMDVKMEQLDSNIRAAFAGSLTVPKPVLTATISCQTDSFAPQTAKMYESQVIHNSLAPYDVDNTMNNVNGGFVFNTISDGDNEIKLVDGRYLIEFGAMNNPDDSAGCNGGDVRWKFIKGDGSTWFPTRPNENVFTTAVQNDTSDFEEEGSVHMKTILTIKNGETLRFQYDMIACTSEVKVRGSVVITRLSNRDDTTGTIETVTIAG